MCRGEKMLREADKSTVRFAMVWAVVVGSALADPAIVLDNGAIRVEIDPQVFAVRFVGIPGGANFLSPLPAEASARNPDTWVDAGGLQTDLLPFVAKDPAVRRGPAQVIEKRSDYVALLGPASGVSGMRVKKEVQLIGAKPQGRFRVSIMRVGPGEKSVSIRNTARLDAGVTVRLERDEGEPRMLAGSETLTPYIVKSRKYWLIPVPSTSPARGVIVGAVVPTVTVVNKSGVWRRRLVSMPDKSAKLPQSSTVLCLLDDATKTYGVAVQSPSMAVSGGAVAALEEEWEVDWRVR